ncbi:outer membrane protein [Opitutaceae bacterium TAV1]|nr:outer membrane protein [Opitutaceae bacterium TAV1]
MKTHRLTVLFLLASVSLQPSASGLFAAEPATAATALPPVPPPAPLTDPAPGIPEKLDLPTALAFAVQHNYAIRLAREQIEEQEGVIIEVRADAIPHVSLDGAYRLNEKEISNYPGDRDQDWNIALTVRQKLYAGGGVRAALDAQTLVREAAILSLQSVISDALLEVRTRYYDVLLAREQITVQQQNVELLEEQLQTARNRYEAGSVSHFDVLRAEVELANAQPGLITARNNFRIAIDELRRVLGYTNLEVVDPHKAPEFVGKLEFTPVAYDLAASIEKAIRDRPELQRLDKITRAREAGVSVAVADYRPTFDLVGGYQVRRNQTTASFSDSQDGWLVGVEGSWAIFDGAATRGRVRQARSQLEQSKIQFQSERLRVEVEVRRALSSLQEATELASAAGKVVDQAEEALRLADARYGAGSATQLDQLQARTALTEARLNQLQANYNYLVSVATIQRAIAASDRYELPE